MLVSISTMLATISLLLAAFVIYFLFVKPLAGIKFYRAQGIKMNFFPLLGNFKSCIDALATTGDFYGHWVKQIKAEPNIKAFGGNFLDCPQLYLVDPKLIKEYYSKQDNYIKLRKINELAKVMAKDGLVVSEGEIWKRHRRIVASAFHYDLLKEIIPDMATITDQFLADFQKRDLNKVNLAQEFEIIAGEVIGRLFFGQNFNTYKIQGKPVIAFISELTSRLGSEGATLLYLLFGIRIIKWGILPKHRKMWKDLNDWRNFAEDMVEKKKEEARDKNTSKTSGLKNLIEVLLNQSAEGVENSLSTEEIVDEFMTFVGAGSITTGSTASRIIYYLDKNPQYKAKLIEEVNKNFGDPSKVTLDTLNQMDFMTAIIKETLRLSPPVLGLLDREAIADHTLGDLKIKKGTAVNLGNLLNNFNPNYHEDVDSFYPERWLTYSKTKESIAKNSFVFIPFSSGSRNCIGQHLAMNELKIILSLFLRKYDFVLDPSYKHQMTQRIVYETVDAMNFKLIRK